MLLLACLAWPVRFVWRKSWRGPIAFQIVIQIPLWGQTISLKQRSSWLYSLINWAKAPMKHSMNVTIQQYKHRLAFLQFIAPVVVLSSWQAAIELGFNDPSLTGEYLGLLYAMPPKIQRSLRMTFEQEGIRSRGDATFILRPIALFLKICAWWWTQRRSLVA